MNLQSIFESPDQFLHQFDEPDAVFLEMDREAYFRSIFVDGRISPKNAAQKRVRCADLFSLAEKVQPGRICYIFHIAHCGSTLLARALDLKERNLVVREPFALRQLGANAARGESADFDRCVRLMRVLLSRRYDPAGPVIVKANVPVNFMIPSLMQPAPDQEAVFLYYGFDDYLLAILRSPVHRGWVERVSAELQPGIEAMIGPRGADESVAVLAARLWLTQMLQFDRALSAYPNASSLSAEDLFEQPRSVIAAAFSHFGQPQDGETIERIARSDLFSRYSKDPKHQFDNAQRVARRERLKGELAAELDAARAWVSRQPAFAQLPKRLARPLVGQGCALLG